MSALGLISTLGMTGSQGIRGQLLIEGTRALSGHAMTGTGLPLLTLVVCFGAVVPVVPTGAAVSAAAAVAFHQNYAIAELAGVILAGAVGAYLGDVVVYGALRWGGERLGGRLRKRAGTQERLRRVETQLEEHQVSTLLISRLIPGGRIPVLLAAAVAGYPFRRFLSTDSAAASLWSLVYAGIGVAGGAIFPHPWEGVVAAVVLAVGVGAAAGKLHHHDASPTEAGTAS